MVHILVLKKKKKTDRKSPINWNAAWEAFNYVKCCKNAFFTAWDATGWDTRTFLTEGDLKSSSKVFKCVVGALKDEFGDVASQRGFYCADRLLAC